MGVDFIHGNFKNGYFLTTKWGVNLYTAKDGIWDIYTALKLTTFIKKSDIYVTLEQLQVVAKYFLFLTFNLIF